MAGDGSAETEIFIEGYSPKQPVICPIDDCGAKLKPGCIAGRLAARIYTLPFISRNCPHITIYDQATEAMVTIEIKTSLPVISNELAERIINSLDRERTAEEKQSASQPEPESAPPAKKSRERKRRKTSSGKKEEGSTESKKVDIIGILRRLKREEERAAAEFTDETDTF